MNFVNYLHMFASLLLHVDLLKLFVHFLNSFSPKFTNFDVSIMDFNNFYGEDQNRLLIQILSDSQMSLDFATNSYHFQIDIFVRLKTAGNF